MPGSGSQKSSVTIRENKRYADRYDVVLSGKEAYEALAKLGKTTQALNNLSGEDAVKLRDNILELMQQ